MKQIFAIAIVAAAPSFALTCGQVVSGVVTLTEDLDCNSQTALRVGADNTVINLNGFSITCTGAGYLGSCQTATGQNPVTARGIEVSGKKGVVINGPGVVSGFQTGVLLLNAGGAAVKGVTITGPSSPLGLGQRGGAAGIYTGGFFCPIVAFGQDAPPSLVIADNDISNQAQGLHIENTACASIKGNKIHAIHRDGGYSLGMFFYNADNNEVLRNSIFGVGANQMMDHGMLFLAGSSRNTVSTNTVSNNAATGIHAMSTSGQNKFLLNVARFNGVSPATDLADSSTGAPNTWNTNNICKTEGGNVPANVCNPVE